MSVSNPPFPHLPRHLFIAVALAAFQAPFLMASGRGAKTPKTAAPGNPKEALRALLAAKKAARTGGASPNPRSTVGHPSPPGGGASAPASLPAAGEKVVNGRGIHRGANLRGADLRWADLRNCDLRDAHLKDADLTGAKLDGAHCQGADFQGARLFMADLSLAEDLDLTGAQIHPFFQDEAGAITMANRSRPTVSGWSPGGAWTLEARCRM